MIASLALVLAFVLAAQNADTVYRNDPQRSAYQEAADACRDADRLLESSPEGAIEKLRPIFAESIDRNRLTHVEKRIFIEAKAQEFNPHEFFPYFLRGRARLLLGRTKKDEEARRLFLDAAGDLQNSLARGASRSREPLGEARKELWSNLRAALAYESWKAGRAGLADQAFALLATTELAGEANHWISAEAARLEASLRELRRQPGDPETKRPPARLAHGWCDALGGALKGLPPFAGAADAVQKAMALAVAIRDSRGFFRLKIGVSPFAAVERIQRDGEEIALVDRDTPLIIPQELEIDDYSVDLVHPNGRKTFRILAKDLKAGGSYVLWGDMGSGTHGVAELPK